MTLNKRFAKWVLALGLGLGLAVGGQSVAQQVGAASGVITIHYVPGYGVALWNSPNTGRQAIKGRILKDGTKWKFSQIKQVNGKTWYQLGTNQWVEGTYAKTGNAAPVITAKKGTLHITYKPGYGVLVRTQPNGAAVKPAKYLMNGTSWQYTATSVAAGKTWYRVGTNQWIEGTYVQMGLAPKPSAPKAPAASHPATNLSGYTNTRGASSIIGDSSTHVFHLPSQRNYQISNANVVRFSSAASAIAAGYRQSKR
ncbi:SLAP domain-containing protein [Lacticaseibacillus saniviri]